MCEEKKMAELLNAILSDPPRFLNITGYGNSFIGFPSSRMRISLFTYLLLLVIGVMTPISPSRALWEILSAKFCREPQQTYNISYIYNLPARKRAFTTALQILVFKTLKNQT